MGSLTVESGQRTA